MADSTKRMKKRKLRSTEDQETPFKAPRFDQSETKIKEPKEDTQQREATQNFEDDPPWRNLQLILSLKSKDIDLRKVDLAYDYVKLRVSEEADHTSQKLETVSNSRAIVFLNNWIQTLLISSEKKIRGEGDKPQFGVNGSCLDYRCWEILKFTLEESLKLNVSLSFSRDFLRVIQCIAKDVLSRISAGLGGKELELYDIAVGCVSSVFSSHGGVSNENLDLWALAVGTVLELVEKILVDKLNGGNASIFVLRFSCVVIEPFIKFLRVHPTRKNGFHDFIDKLLEPALYLLNVLHLDMDVTSVELTRNLMRLLEDVLSQGLFHPTHIDGFMGLQTTSKYKASEDGKPKDLKTVIKSYHRHLFDKLEKIVGGKHSMALGGIGELYRLYVHCLRKQRGVSVMNAETRKSLFDFFVQIMEPLLHKIDTFLHAELEIGPMLLDVHCTVKSANKVLFSFMHEKVYIRTEDTSEGAWANFLKVVYDMIISFSAKINQLLPSTYSLDKGSQKEVLNLIAKELIVAVRYLMEIEYDVVGDDLESLWFTMFSYAALGLSYMDLQDQSLLTSEILHIGCQLINLYSDLRQVNSSVFALCRAVRRLVLSVQDHQICYAKSKSSTPSLYYKSCAKLLRIILCSQELRLSVYNAIKSIPEGQVNGCIRNLTTDISESLKWMKEDVENCTSPCFNLRAELLGRGLSDIYTLILDSVTVTTGNSVLVGVSVKDLMAIIRPSMSSLVAIQSDGVYNFLSTVMGRTFNKRGNEYLCSHWFVVFFFRLYMSCRSLHRQVISLVPPETSKKMSDAMGDSFTAYSSRDWLEKTGGTNEGYFSWIAEPSASFLVVAQAVSGVCLKDTVTNCSALIYVLNAMALQRLVDLNRLIKSFEYLLQGNDNLISSKLTDDDGLSLDRKRGKKWKRCVADLREEAADLTKFMLGYLPLVAEDQASISSCSGATHGDMSPQVQPEGDAWDFGVGAMDEKSLPSAIWWLICQNIDIWSTHAAKKKLKMFLSILIQNSLQSLRSSVHDFGTCSPSKPGNLKRVSMHQLSFELLSDSVLYEQRFVRRHMASSFCQILEKAVSPIFSNFQEVDLKSPPDWTEVSSALENSSVVISSNEIKSFPSITHKFTSCQSLLNFLCWMPKEYLSCRSFSLYATCILNFERLLVGSLLDYHGALHSSDHYEHFRLFMSCRRALRNLIMTSSEERIEAYSFPVLWLLKSLSAVVGLQHTFPEDGATQVRDIIFSLMDHTSYMFLTLCKYQFIPAIHSSIFDLSEDTDAWKGVVLVAEALSEYTQSLLIPLKNSLHNGKMEIFSCVEELKKLSSVISCFQGFLWGLASALDHIATETCNLKTKLPRGKFEPLYKINLCIDTFADFVSYFLCVLVLEDDGLNQTLANAQALQISESDGDLLVVKHVDADSILSKVDLLFDEKCLKKSILRGFLRGENLEAAIFLRQLFIASAAIIRLDLHMKCTSLSSSLVPIFIGVSQALLLEFANNSEAPHPFSFLWLDGTVKFLEELGSHFPSIDSTFSRNVYAKLIDLHLRAIGKCISLQGKRATLASHGTELSAKTLNSQAGLSESTLARGPYHLDEFKVRLRMSFKIFVEKPSELHLLSAIQAIERALVGVQEGCMINYEICTGSSDGGKVSSIVAAGVDCLDLIMEFVKGRKRLSMVRRHIQSLVACLFNIILHLHAPQIFHANVIPNADPDSGAVILMCVEVLTRVIGKHALFQMNTSQIGQSLRIPSALFQNFLQLRIPKAPSQSNSLRFLYIKGTESVEKRNNFSVDRQFSIDIYAACCRLLCTVLKHHKRESQLCIALIESSVRVLLHCLEMVDVDSSVKEGFLAWEVHDGVKCACFLRRIYEEIRQQKDILGQHCFQFLSNYIWIYSGYSPHKSGIRREIDEALRPGVYALIDACSADDLQHIHTVFGEGPCRSTLASLQNDYKQNFQYEGKV